MKKINFTIYILAILLFFSTLCMAQKSGHLNFNNVLSMMPQTTVAKSELESYQKNLLQQGEAMVARFQEEYGEFVKQVQSGGISPIQQLQTEASLQKKQQEILAYEQEVIRRVRQKQAILRVPIGERALQAIKEVALENGYEAVFDTSILNTVHFAEDSDDLTSLVKTKLGI